jgi:signal transduction histidine kinase
MRRSSVSAKIFIAFLVVMATFGGVTAYGALAMRRLGDELRRISRGYLTLRIDVHDLQTLQYNLLQYMELSTDDKSQRSPAFVKGVVDTARAFRKSKMRKLEELVARLEDEAPNRAEADFLRQLGDRMKAVDAQFVEDESLFDRVYSHLPPRPGDDPASLAGDREKLIHREDRIYKKDLGDLSRDLRDRVQRAEDQLERDERRAVWATVLLAIVAAALGLGITWLVQRALAPLRRLAAGAKELARGDYQQRVQVDASDEIGSLAREFNAMAAALEEREVRLIRSERLAAIGKIAAQITHEVRNPLSSIGLNAEMLEEELTEGEPRELVRAIVKEVDRLAEITEQYLRFARMPRPKLEREDVNGIVKSLLAFLKEEFAARGITVEADLDPDVPPTPADENQLRQALLNLLRNGAEAMKDGGRLTITTRAVNGQLRVSIADTGQGIAAEHQKKIFDPFFSTKEGGTGLGLALTQQIVVDHGGTLEVESDLGRGATFTVSLPTG